MSEELTVEELAEMRRVTDAAISKGSDWSKMSSPFSRVANPVAVGRMLDEIEWLRRWIKEDQEQEKLRLRGGRRAR